jgi:hypothetical protein
MLDHRNVTAFVIRIEPKKLMSRKTVAFSPEVYCDQERNGFECEIGTYVRTMPLCNKS